MFTHYNDYFPSQVIRLTHSKTDMHMSDWQSE